MDKEIIFEIITKYLGNSFANLHAINRNYETNAITYYFSKLCNQNLANLFIFTNSNLNFDRLISIYSFDLDQNSFIIDKTLFFYSSTHYDIVLDFRFEIKLQFKQYSRLLKVSINKYTKLGNI